MTSPTRQLFAVTALVLAATAAFAQAGPPPPAREEPFAETIDVVETSALVELPPRRDAARPTDLLLLEAGMPREVVRVEPLGDEPWDLVVWIDGPLCEPAALETTLLALGQQTEALTRLGTVRVVVAAPAPQTVVPATREPQLLAERLTALVRESSPCSGRVGSLLWEARQAGTTAAGERVLVALRELVEQRHAQLRAAAPPCGGEACALLLVAHGYPPHADLALPSAMRPPDGPRLAAALDEATAALGRNLAVARWTVVALPFAPPRPLDAQEEVPPGARPGAETAGPSLLEGGGTPLYRVWPPGGRSPHRDLPAASWDVYTLPELAALRTIADLTSGMVLRSPEQLPAAIEALGSRVKVWYRTAAFAPGEERSLEVLVGEPLRRGGAPAWVGAPAPPATARPPG
jgi:hypothetical protein